MNYYKLAFFIVFFSLILNCKDFNKANKQTLEILKEKGDKVSNYTTLSMEFKGPDSLPSGWNTIKYENQSNETHFLVFEKYPEGITIDSTKAHVFPVFDKGMDLINEGKAEEGFAAFNNLPTWFFNVEFTGGTGLVSPKHEAISTIKLDSGRYLIECYIKMKNGKFHSVMGMYKEIIVTDSASEIEEPKATIEVDISGDNGIVFNPDFGTGEHIFKVNFIDQKLHENFVGHDINLVKLSNNPDLEELEAWMNWSSPKGFIDPAPNNITFLGGIQEMAAGKHGYFKVNLKPGKYALISEVPAAKSKKMFKVFEVIDK
ncbi:MAG: hypothetical protein HKO01_07500 [Flaviramulus sp.]|nr:hypothetical protein [Flaviramulus sp.]NNC50362.1 hypothetical protein [Flaviramulus sp.]